MPKNFSRFQLLTLCRNYIVVGIVAALACLLGGVATASPGQIDPTFGVQGRVISHEGRAMSIAVQADGKLVTAGQCAYPNIDFCIVRYTKSGTLDTAFGNGGKVVTAIGTGWDFALRIKVQADQKLLVAGYCAVDVSWRICLARYLPDGTLDMTFGQTGQLILFIVSGTGYSVNDQVRALELAPDGKILVGGTCLGGTGEFDFCIARLLPNGDFDMSFGVGGRKLIALGDSSDSAYGIQVQSDGKVLLGGTCQVGLKNVFCTTRLLANGQLDIEFNGSGRTLTAIAGTDDWANSVLVQSDGKILLAGRCVVLGDRKPCMVRYLSTGALDLSFGVNGKVVTLTASVGEVSTALIQSDGQIVFGSSCSTASGTAFCVARYLQNGAISSVFGLDGLAVVLIGSGNANGFSAQAEWATIQSDGKIVLAGDCLNDLTFNACLVRLKNGPHDPLTCALNVDANQVISFTTDALLIARYIVGLRGSALTNSALGQNPTRTGQALETYLASLDLDVDGDGQSLATTDGLLLLRAMLGLTGDALTHGATNAAHPNVRNAQQILTWIESTHGVACLP